MERTVPRAASEEIELYLRTMYSLLRSTTEVRIRTLEEVHAGMNSSLHMNARKEAPDTSAFIYALLRLPDCMPDVKSVVLGQSSDLFEKSGYPNVESWQKVSARARRRRCFFNQVDTLACYIASQSDIDDLIPTLTAYQIEWNKLHILLQSVPNELIARANQGESTAFSELSERLQLTIDDLGRFKVIWGSKFADNLGCISRQSCDLKVRLLGGSLSQYWRATRAWWDHIENNSSALIERPVYFISSNPHSVTNLISGFALQHEPELIKSLERSHSRDLLEEWKGLSQGNIQSRKENFLYYLLKRYQDSGNPNGGGEDQEKYERHLGITRIRSEHYFDVDAQVIELSRLKPELFDPRLAAGAEVSCLKHSDALILNIDYPLGLAGYNILAKVAEYSNPILGVYIMGKAASLNGRNGDIIIPKVVHDEHSQNTYLFQNCFAATDVTPYLVYGTVLDNQKAVSVLGTFLQNADYMDVFYREGYSDIEMESGPYLSAMYEMVRPKRHPVNEIVNLYGAPFDIGILHYVSDTPLSKGRNLGAGTLSYFGMDSTYASTIAILRRILQVECIRLDGSGR